MIKKISLGLIFFSFTCKASIWQEELRWDWSKINLDDATFWQNLNFPKNFSWGIGISALELEGIQNHSGTIKNNWTEDEVKGPLYKKNNGAYNWYEYKKYIADAKNAGLNTFRLSIPWEKIEPEKGIYDEVAMQHYCNIIKHMKAEGIEPWVCLFHFTFPVWFSDLGGFEKENNMDYFIKFCEYIFDKLHDNVRFFATYNEPVAYANEAYFRGKFPPRYSWSWKNPGLSGQVLKNMLNAHVKIYELCKKKDPTCQIGIIKMFHPLDPQSSSNYLEKKAAHIGNYLLHDIFLNFFKTGYFNWFYLVRDYNEKAIKALDFIGLNYYCHELIQFWPTFKTTKAREEIEQKAPDNGKGIYPEGLFRSIELASSLNVPIYITENGIADSTEQLRNSYIKKHLYVIKKALNEDFDIRGYHYWTLIDPIIEGNPDKPVLYGLYGLKPNTRESFLREGAKPFINFLHTQMEKT